MVTLSSTAAVESKTMQNDDDEDSGGGCGHNTSGSGSSSSSSYLELLSVLNQPRLAELWDADTEEYINELSGMELHRLVQEPQRLHEEHSALVNETQELAFNNYKTFVQTANCGRDIRLQMVAVSQRLESLRRKLPACVTGCEELANTCEDITGRWKLTSQTLTRHKRLVEILEIPQLMETCVKNGNFDEALELAAHVKRLERRHGHIPLVATIGREVRHQQALMQSHLLSQLRGPVQLPACLRLIGHLRRMEMHSTHELKVRFLETRGAWFDSLLAQSDAAVSAAAGSPSSQPQDAYSRLSRLLELYRVHLFDLITQYKAIFPVGQAGSTDDGAAGGGSCGSGADEDVCLFQGWLVAKIENLLRRVRESLSADPECRLDALVSQCMYAGLSFSRVGADFRPLLTPIFEEALTTRCHAHLSRVYPQCLQMLQQLDLTSGVVVDDDNATTTTTTTAATSTVEPESLSADSSVTNAPPNLLAVPPLAVYCNALLAVFNELRVCPLPAAVTDLVAVISRQLTSIAETIRTLHNPQPQIASAATTSTATADVPGAGSIDRREDGMANSGGLCTAAAAGGTRERGFQRMTEIFVADFVPFVARTFETLLPTATVARLVGCSLPQAERLTGCRIDVAEVTKTLSEFVFQDEASVDSSLNDGDPSSSLERAEPDKTSGNVVPQDSAAVESALSEALVETESPTVDGQDEQH